MRMMLRGFPGLESGNEALTNGTLPEIIKRVMEMIRPEAAFFYPDRGKRSFLMVFDLASPSDIPKILEPLFLELNCEVELLPVMSVQDLEEGFKKLSPR